MSRELAVWGQSRCPCRVWAEARLKPQRQRSTGEPSSGFPATPLPAPEFRQP
jgi:hypothetical protein